MNKKFIVANWKSNFQKKDIKNWLNIVGPESKNCPAFLDIVVAPSFIHLEYIKQEITKNNYSLKLCGQNVSPYLDGAFTGEVSAKQLYEYVNFVIIGHSERRKHFRENNELITQKVLRTLDYNLIPIVCISDTDFENQLSTVINNLDNKQSQKVIFMYEPPSAISIQVGPIGQGKASSLDEVTRMALEINKKAPGSLVFYGGSIKADNITQFLKQSEIAGVVIGSASLNPAEFVKIIRYASQI